MSYGISLHLIDMLRSNEFKDAEKREKDTMTYSSE